MRISPEGKAGLWVAIIALAGTGALAVFPDHTEIGWTLLAISAVGAVLLIFHHVCEKLGISWRAGHKQRMVALAGMIVCGVGFLGFVGIYFWPRPAPVTLASLFQSDFKKESAAFLTRTMTVHPHDNSWKVTVTVREFMDFDTNSKFISVFVPDNGHTFEACVGVAQNLPLETSGTEKFGAFFGIGGDSNLTWSNKLKFTGRVYLYHEGVLDLQQMAYLDRLFQEHGAALQLRGGAYLDRRLHDDNAEQR